MKWLLTDTTRSDRNETYWSWLDAAGVSHDMISVGQELDRDLRDYGALLLTGGGDIDPAFYQQGRARETKNVQRDRDRQEIELVRRCMDVGVAVFGICRGIQVLNVALGGGLIQHIPVFLETAAAGSTEKHSAKSRSCDAVHEVRFTGASALSDAWKGCDEVNSAHHQAIDPSRLPQGLRVIATSGLGVIEAVEGQGLQVPVLAVQWHPERMDATRFPVARLMDLMMELSSARR